MKDHHYIPNKVSIWLNTLHNTPQKLVSVYPPEFNMLRKLVPILPIRTIKDSEGKPMIYRIDKESTISALKQQYRFVDKEEVEQTLKEEVNGTNI